MEIKIEKVPGAIATIELPKFRNALKKDLELEKCFKSFVKITKNDTGKSEEEIVHEMFQGINWGQVMKFINHNKSEIIEIGLNNVVIKGMKHYSPDALKLTDTEAKYTFNEEEDDAQETMVIHSFIPLMEHHVDKLLQDSVFEYGENSWHKSFESR